MSKRNEIREEQLKFLELRFFGTNSPDVVIVNDKIEMKLNLLRHEIFQFFFCFFFIILLVFSLHSSCLTDSHLSLSSFVQKYLFVFFCKAVIYFPAAGPFFFSSSVLCCARFHSNFYAVYDYNFPVQITKNRSDGTLY